MYTGIGDNKSNNKRFSMRYQSNESASKGIRSVLPRVRIHGSIGNTGMTVSHSKLQTGTIYSEIILSSPSGGA